MKGIESHIIQSVNGAQIIDYEIIQDLWSGYGEIRRCWIKGGKADSVIVKHVKLPDLSKHPRGWNTNRSRLRKLKSYQIEINWYQNFAYLAKESARLPVLYFSKQKENEILMVMEDLDAVGFNLRKTSIDLPQIKSCLYWLASFHATYLSVETDKLWSIGTYWHLDTRPDELKEMKYTRLKNAAHKIDNKLNKAKYQTLVHGDAKLANFCFSKESKLAAVDFQYVGKGCGMKDVAYFLSSCLNERDCKKHEQELLSYYFDSLTKLLLESIKQGDIDEMVSEWKSLYKYAWADFYRFLDGWSPGHWKMHGYSQQLTEIVLNELEE